jgi:hypothetical protein
LQRALIPLALILAFALALALAFALGSFAAKGEPSAEPIDPRGEPLQAPLTAEELRAPSPFRHEQVIAAAQARYRITARVLARERYYLGWQGDISPLDLALGWGAMSDPAVDEFISWGQGMRWYFFVWSKSSPYDNEAIAQQSANVHIVPASKNVRRALLALDEDDLVRIDGYLINVQGPDGEQWASSLSRSDRGGTSCELLLATELLDDGIRYR